MISLKLLSKRVPDVKVLIIREMHRNNKSYYDALGLTPKATSADIKKAYYKMSMVYHPDKEAGNSEKFREITTAYEVLGNLKLKKLYDQGLLPAGAVSNAASEAAAKKKDEELKVKAERVRQRHTRDDGQASGPKATYTGKTEHYDFDAWTRAHYSETFTKQHVGKKQYYEEKQARNLQKLARLQRLEAMAWCSMLSILVFIYWLQNHYLNYDKARFSSNVKEK